MIIGIHIGARGERTSIVATVCQEDLIQIATKPESLSDEAPAFKIAGHCFVADPDMMKYMEDLDDGGYSFDDSERLTYIGHAKSLFSPSWTRGGKMRPTILSTELNTDILPNDQGPAPVSFLDKRIDPEWLEKMPTDSRGKPSLGAAQLAHISGSHEVLDADIRKKATDSLVDMWLSVPGILDWDFLSTEQTLNGIQSGPYGGYIGPIRGDVSPGLPWKKMGCHRKSDLLEDLSEKGEMRLWTFKRNPAGEQLASRYTDTLELWAMGEQPLRFVDCNLKVEALPLLKVHKGNARMFLAESMEAFLAQRTVCGFLQALVMKTRWHRHQHHTTGINPYTEFQILYQRLKEVSDKGFDGDYSKFDKKIPVWAWEILADVMVRIAAKTPISTRSGWENSIRGFVKNLRTKLYVYEGSIYLADGDQASGVYPTNIGDSWLNDIIVVVVLTEIMDSNPVAWKHLQRGNRLDMEKLADYFAWFTHGDDIITAVHEDMQSEINFKAFKAILATHGMLFTLPSKNDDTADAQSIEELTFIGRSFEFDDNSNRPHGRLRETAIARQLHWTNDLSWPHMMEVLDSTQIELRAFSEDRYNEITEDVSRVMAEKGKPYIFASWQEARLDLNEQRDQLH
jgi:hypothetical protein